MKKAFYKRLAKATLESGADLQDFVTAYEENTSYRNHEHAHARVKMLLGNAVETLKVNAPKWTVGAITEEDIFACAKACNCTSDYLLGLSDRMN